MISSNGKCTSFQFRLAVLSLNLAFLIVFLFDFYIGKICVLPHAEFVVFLVLRQIVLSPSVEAGDEFLHAPPVSEVLGALDLRDASLEGLALE